jgi:dienelactone hydrolase
VIQPNAEPNPPLSSWDSNGGDDAVVFDMLERAIRVFHPDEKRIHFTGFSQGGNMSWRMLCAHADLFASVAPAAFASGCNFQGTEVPSREVPILYMHGTDDGLVPFSGALAQRDAVVSGWKMGAGETIAGDGAFERTRYTSPAGTVFEFLTHDYVIPTKCAIVDLKGHCFPGSSDPGGATGQACSFACPPPSPFNWGEEVMAFFQAHPKP